MGALVHFEASLIGFRAEMTEIEASPSYLMLRDASETGDTARKYGSAAADARGLWGLIDGVAAQLSEARDFVDNNGSNGARSTELRRLLEQRSIVAVEDPSSTPARSARRYTVSEAFREIRRRYEAVRAGVTEIDQLWVSVLPRVEAARTSLDRLQAEADDLGVLEPLIGRAKALAEDLAERLVADPASVSIQDGTNLDVQVANAAKQMATLRTGHDNLDGDFNATEELLASLRVLRARAEAARTEALAKIDQPQGLVRVPDRSLLDGPDGMAARLDELLENAATAAWTQKRALLDSWLTSAVKLEAQLNRAGDANRGPVEARNELRGRLRAYTAKMAAMGRAEDLELADLVDRARSELYTAPTDLATAEAAIADLATRLRA